MSTKAAPLSAVHVDALVGQVASLTPSEVQFLLSSPEALRLLMDHADLMHSQAASMLEPEEIEPWPTKRWTALREKGRSIIAGDPDLWGDDIKRGFGLETPNT